jgi:hypothetical protein
MHSDDRKAQLAAAWMLSVGVAGYAVGHPSVAGWTVLLALALTPPLILMGFRYQPSVTLSEGIREVLR